MYLIIISVPYTNKKLANYYRAQQHGSCIQNLSSGNTLAFEENEKL